MDSDRLPCLILRGFNNSLRMQVRFSRLGIQHSSCMQPNTPWVSPKINRQRLLIPMQSSKRIASSHRQMHLAQSHQGIKGFQGHPHPHLYSSGLYTASLHNTTTFLKNRLHSTGSPFAFTKLTSSKYSSMPAIFSITMSPLI